MTKREQIIPQTSNGKSGKVTMKTSKCCVRTVGPHKIVFDTDGAVIKPSIKGHPLGNGRPLFLPRELCLLVEEAGTSCPAARYKLCTDECRLCGEDPRVFLGPFRQYGFYPNVVLLVLPSLSIVPFPHHECHPWTPEMCTGSSRCSRDIPCLNCLDKQLH